MVGRPFNSTQPLGQMLLHEGMSVQQMSALTGVSYRTISDYLANRKLIPSRHMMLFCELFDCEPEDLTPTEEPNRANYKEGAYG